MNVNNNNTVHRTFKPVNIFNTKILILTQSYFGCQILLVSVELDLHLVIGYS